MPRLPSTFSASDEKVSHCKTASAGFTDAVEHILRELHERCCDAWRNECIWNVLEANDHFAWIISASRSVLAHPRPIPTTIVLLFDQPAVAIGIPVSSWPPPETQVFPIDILNVLLALARQLSIQISIDLRLVTSVLPDTRKIDAGRQTPGCAMSSPSLCRFYELSLFTAFSLSRAKIQTPDCTMTRIKVHGE